MLSGKCFKQDNASFVNVVLSYYEQPNAMELASIFRTVFKFLFQHVARDQILLIEAGNHSDAVKVHHCNVIIITVHHLLSNCRLGMCPVSVGKICY